MSDGHVPVNFSDPRNYSKVLKSDVKEALFPDDPFRQFRHPSKLQQFKNGLSYFIPMVEWFPNYTLSLFKFDLLSGITIASLAIPQGISYAKLGNIPPIVGLYSSFIPPLVYAIFGSSKNLAVGTLAACSLLIAQTIEEKVPLEQNPTLFLNLVFTTAFITGVFQAALGILRLGLLVDFLSHSTITGFKFGTSTIIILQQMKGFLGYVHFTSKTDVVSVIGAIIRNWKEWRWESTVLGLVFLAFLQAAHYVRQKKPNLFWVSAIAPIITVLVGCAIAYFAKGERHGIAIVGHLQKGLNPISIHNLNFDPKYLPATLRAGIITGIIALTEGIAVGRTFAILKNQQIDGNKEMIAYGFMNIIGSFFSCYLTTGPFSKTAVNFNAGCKTQMSNVVQAICLMLTLLFLAPIFSYTPLVSLSAIITSAMMGLLRYEEVHHLFKVDKGDFIIFLAAFFGVIFVSMDYGLMMSVGLAVVRALLYVARPTSCKLGAIPNSNLHRDVEQYPDTVTIPGIMVIQMGSPIYFATCTYLRERILRFIREEQEVTAGNDIEHVILDLSGVTAIDMSGIGALEELLKSLQVNSVKITLVNPRIDIMEKMQRSKFIDKIGKESVFLSVEEAIESCQFSLSTSKSKSNDEHSNPNTV
uniref:STAS domain-containing protein n=1 Tax=Kalanchoe fedtschenkoi TaxID=63787 RepID=A0A7N0T866_KALFE